MALAHMKTLYTGRTGLPIGCIDSFHFPVTLIEQRFWQRLQELHEKLRESQEAKL